MEMELPWPTQVSVHLPFVIAQAHDDVTLFGFPSIQINDTPHIVQARSPVRPHTDRQLTMNICPVIASLTVTHRCKLAHNDHRPLSQKEQHA